MNNGDMVFYRHLHRGGYGYETRHPAVVVKIHGSKHATIRVARIALDTKTTYPAEVRVSMARLAPRSAACSFESVLSGRADLLRVAGGVRG